MAKRTNLNINIKNRKAEYEYFLLTTYTAGIVLSGTEIKSIRAGKANLTDSYCSFINNELWVHNMHISEYANGSYNNHEPKRDRKLLLNRSRLRNHGEARLLKARALHFSRSVVQEKRRSVAHEDAENDRPHDANRAEPPERPAPAFLGMPAEKSGED